MAPFIKFYRGISKVCRFIASALRVAHYRLSYPGLKIDFKTYLGPNVRIECYDGGSLRIFNCVIQSGTHIVVDHQGQADIRDSFIGPNCVITCKKQLTIKQNCQIAEMVVIRDQDHKFGQLGLSLVEQGFNSAEICIGENVWLASKVTILKGVYIGNNAVIGASSVVRNDVEENSVYVGIPARKVK